MGPFFLMANDAPESLRELRLVKCGAAGGLVILHPGEGSVSGFVRMMNNALPASTLADLPEQVATIASEFFEVASADEVAIKTPFSLPEFRCIRDKRDAINGVAFVWLGARGADDAERSEGLASLRTQFTEFAKSQGCVWH